MNKDIKINDEISPKSMYKHDIMQFNSCRMPKRQDINAK